MKKNIFILLSAIGFVILLSCKKSQGGDIISEPDAPGLTTPIGIPNGIPVLKTIGNVRGSLIRQTVKQNVLLEKKESRQDEKKKCYTKHLKNQIKN